MTKRLLSIGEIMVELAPDADGRMTLGFAGDTFNTAWYARRLLPPDWQVDYFTALGTDDLSDDVARFIEAQGIGTRHIRRLTDRTVGLYMIRLKDGERSFSYWRGQSAARRLADDEDALNAATDGADVIWLSGITLAILDDAGRRRLRRALSSAKTKGAIVALDTNLRQALWPSVDEMRQTITSFALIADIVLPSFDEEEATFGDADAKSTIARYRTSGVSTIVVKNGSEPCQAWSAEEGAVCVAPTPVTRVVDSTAAGDAFGAGFVAARVQGKDLTSAIRSAAVLAAQVICHRGALAPGIFEKGANP